MCILLPLDQRCRCILCTCMYKPTCLQQCTWTVYGSEKSNLSLKTWALHSSNQRCMYEKVEPDFCTHCKPLTPPNLNPCWFKTHSGNTSNKNLLFSQDHSSPRNSDSHLHGVIFGAMALFWGLLALPCAFVESPQLPAASWKSYCPPVVVTAFTKYHAQCKRC